MLRLAIFRSPSSEETSDFIRAVALLRQAGIKTGIVGENVPHLGEEKVDWICRLDDNTLERVSEWCDVPMREVAYMGKDNSDMEILKRVLFPACAQDAESDLKQRCTVFSATSQESSVLQFARAVIQRHEEMDSITAIIPVRKGSKRCKKKNIREFGWNTSLLKKKIEILLELKEISSVLVTSDCDEMLAAAETAGAKTHKRDDIYCGDNDSCPASTFFHHLGALCPTGTMMHVPCTTPFVNPDTYRKAIEMWKHKDRETESLNSVIQQKHFFWKGETAINYDPSNPPNSQDLPDWTSLSFAFNIISRSAVLRYSNVVGKRPKFVITDSLEGIDIDTETDFVMASQLERLGVRTCDDIMAIMRKGRPRLLDCTIRDGGYLNNWNFTDSCVRECYAAVSRAGFEYCEIGFRTNRDLLKGKGKWCYSSEEDIRGVFDESCLERTKLVLMAKVGTVLLSDFRPRSESLVHMVRVLVPKVFEDTEGTHRFEFDDCVLEDMKDLASGLIRLGYEVCVNIPCANSITHGEWIRIFSRLKGVELNAIYLADTYGGSNIFNVANTISFVRMCMRQTDVDFNIGFHAHNNQGDAVEKTGRAVEAGVSMIDSCIYGLGRGAGNLESEVAALRFNDNSDPVSLTSILEFIEHNIVSKRSYKDMPFAMRHPLFVLSGYLDIHPDYVDSLLKKKSSISTDVKILISLASEGHLKNRRNFSETMLLETLNKELKE